MKSSRGAIADDRSLKGTAKTSMIKVNREKAMDAAGCRVSPVHPVLSGASGRRGISANDMIPTIYLWKSRRPRVLAPELVHVNDEEAQFID